MLQISLKSKSGTEEYAVIKNKIDHDLAVSYDGVLVGYCHFATENVSDCMLRRCIQFVLSTTCSVFYHKRLITHFLSTSIIKFQNALTLYHCTFVYLIFGVDWHLLL